ncbi:DUF2189 domain-containing protein [Shimia thalassica]|uniref:DUF2189 domain-containing protein n=1 Tax=Shimia thalassica TaxID=1715693 RepID=UPI0026E4366D|nr:DUF2189 domain-containing protein [Shimia thalassica]MDO6797640.1 DUF2189 domain-containing protein [Shimia thalassica]
MVETIGNPLSWSAKAIAGSGRAAEDIATHLGSDARVSPRVHRLEVRDVFRALRLGLDDMMWFRTDVVALVAVYPLIGVLLSVMAFEMALLPAVFPMATGFVLLGPVAAIGMYALSKLHEAGESPSISNTMQLLKARTTGPVIVLAGYLVAVFALWMVCAMWVYGATLGPEPPVSVGQFVTDALTTPRGWSMIWIGCGIGVIFAGLVLVTSLVSFPMLVDRPVGLPVAVTTSVRVAVKNPLVTAVWGVTIAFGMFLGSLPIFIGLILVLPVLGHATWHLYRKAVSFD